MRRAPKIATFLLKLVCSSPDHDSVTGDLLEQYQNGRGWFWYWRQVFGIVLLELYRKVARRPLIHTTRISPPLGLALVLVIATLLSILMSDLWFLGLGVLFGVVVGGLKFAYDNNLIESREDDLTSLGPIPVDRAIPGDPFHDSRRTDDHRTQ
jgi:hypothetical protein